MFLWEENEIESWKHDLKTFEYPFCRVAAHLRADGRSHNKSKENKQSSIIKKSLPQDSTVK